MQICGNNIWIKDFPLDNIVSANSISEYTIGAMESLLKDNKDALHFSYQDLKTLMDSIV